MTEVCEKNPEYYIEHAKLGLGAAYPSFEHSHQHLSMLDVVVRLWRRKTLMILVFITTIALALFYVALRQVVYEYTTVLEIGSYSLEDDAAHYQKNQMLEAPEQTKSKLEKRFILQELLAQQSGVYDKGEAKTDRLPDQINVFVSPESNIIELVTEGAEGDSARLLSLLEQVNGRLLRDHSVLMAQIQSKLIALAEKRQASTASLYVDIAKLEQEYKFAIKERQNLRNEQSLVRQQVERYDASLKVLAEQRLLAISRGVSTESTVAPLLLESEVFQLQKLRNEVEIRERVIIPGELNKLNKTIAVLNDEISVVRKKIENENKALLRSLNLDPSKYVAKESFDQLVIEKAEFVGLKPTTVVLGPHRSLEPVSLPTYLVLAISALIALFLSFLAALLADFVGLARSKIRQDHVKRPT